MTARKGISALQLSKELGVQCRTAWYMLHRIREACANGDFKLERIVEVDETYLGGKEENKHTSKKLHAGGGAVGKQAVLGMRERQGRTKAMPIPETDKSTLQRANYTHQGVKHSAKKYVNGTAHTNGIESVWALLKRGYTGTYHHFSFKHLQRYLNEGNCEIDTIDRMEAFAEGIGGKRLPYKELIS